MENSRNHQWGKYLPYVMLASEFLLVNVIYLIMTAIFPTIVNVWWYREAWIFVNVSFILPAVMQFPNYHHRRSTPLDHQYINAVKQSVVFSMVFLLLMQFVHADMPSKIYVTIAGLMLLLLPIWRVVSSRILKLYRSRGRNYAKVVIIGTNQTAVRLINEMKADPGFGYEVLGCFDFECSPGFPFRYLGNIDGLDEFVRTHRVNEIYFTLSGDKHDTLKKVIKVADDNIAEFFYVPQMSRYLNRSFIVHNLGTVPVLSLQRNPLKNPFNQFIKRSFDIGFSGLVLLFSPIVFIPVAIGIKMSSPGPIFFAQNRTGYLGKTFRCLKFRTMRVNADADSRQTTKDDPRKTAFGDFLRKTSIDELPQFINVFLGDMSVVGPRPHMLKHTEDYTKIIDKYMVRHIIKPGITGWAQVNGYRGITDEVWKMEKRVEYDVWYIEHWNFPLDLKIIVRTVINAFSGEKNAF